MRLNDLIYFDFEVLESGNDYFRMYDISVEWFYSGLSLFLDIILLISPKTLSSSLFFTMWEFDLFPISMVSKLSSYSMSLSSSSGKSNIQFCWKPCNESHYSNSQSFHDRCLFEVQEQLLKSFSWNFCWSSFWLIICFIFMTDSNFSLAWHWTKSYFFSLLSSTIFSTLKLWF